MELVAIPKEIAYVQAEWDEIGAWGRAVRIMAAFQRSGLSKADFAERLKMSANTVGSWLAGDKDADWSRLISINAIAGLTETWKPSEAERKAAEEKVAELRPALRHAPRRPVRAREEPAPKKKARA